MPASENEDDDDQGVGTGSSPKNSGEQTPDIVVDPNTEIVDSEPVCKDAKIAVPTSGKKDQLVIALNLVAPGDSSLNLIDATNDEKLAVVVTTSQEVAMPLSAVAVQRVKKDPKTTEVRFSTNGPFLWKCPVPKKIADALEEPDVPATSPADPTPPAPTAPAPAPAPAPEVQKSRCESSGTCNPFCATFGKTCQSASSGFFFSTGRCGDGNSTPLPCDSTGIDGGHLGTRFSCTCNL